MRLIKVKNAILLTSFTALVVMGCKKEEFAINTQPDSVTSSTVDFKAVLPASLVATANIMSTNWTFLQRWMGFWARSGSYQDATDEESYDFTNDFGVGIWNNLYSNANNYNFLQNAAKSGGAGFYEAIARIMKAQDFQMLVDVYGNVPYSEAFKGGSIRTPKYDEDQDIYKDLFRQLDTAISLLKDPVLSSTDNNPSIATNDLVFKGNATNWIKYANTLKLRLLMHMGNSSFAGGTEVNKFVTGANEVAEMAKILAEGSGFLGAGLNGHVNPGYSSDKPNPYYNFYVRTIAGAIPGNGDYTKANAYAVGSPSAPVLTGYYQYNGDPRVDRLYTKPGTAAVHRGIRYGELASSNAANTGSALSNISGIGLVPDGAASRAWVFTGFESLFLQAEAARRGLLPGNAKVLLTAAIRESFVWLGLTAAQADSYILANASYPDVDFDGVSQGAGLPAGGMYTIISQKWFALNSIGTLEVWTDYRRTNIVYGAGAAFRPGPPISINPANTKTALPIRLFYPQNEYSLNAANAGAQGAVINVFTGGGLTGMNRIFWDQN